MKVELLSVTDDAMNLLLKTKNTRLKLDEDPATWSEERKAEHLDYMLDTIKSSWEFVDYVFSIDGVTRAFTHQLVRTRQGSYAQQSQRTVDVREQEVLEPQSVRALGADSYWHNGISTVMQCYSDLIDIGTPVQDARGLLPTNMTTSIIAKFNLRTLSEMAKVRLCVRTQGEYQEVFRAMRALVVERHPWASRFIEVHCVATGTCAFPRYGKTDCPIYSPAMDNTAVREAARARFEEVRHEAIPIAKDGRTM